MKTNGSMALSEGQSRYKLNNKVVGNPFSIGESFNALTFRHSHFDIGFDPLIMVDHYTMSGPTFGLHPHAGLSAVSVIFEDSIGKFHNIDSLGNDFNLEPGDLYWLKAGSGVVHDEKPREGATIHGLQIFVNMSNMSKGDAPESLHIKAADVPVFEESGARVRLLLGSCNGTNTKQSPSTPLTILDGLLDIDGRFNFVVKEGESAWLYAVSGTLEVEVGTSKVTLDKGTSVSLKSEIGDLKVKISNTGKVRGHFAVLSGRALDENFVQQGPLVAADFCSLNQTIERLNKGLFGFPC